MDDSDTDSERDCIGPQPPRGASKHVRPENEEEKEDAYLPALPPHLRRPKTGSNTPSPPSLPKPQEDPTKQRLEAEYSGVGDDNQSEDEDDDGMYGPALPPHMLKKRSGNTDSVSVPPRRALVGPVLPKGFVLPSEDSPVETSEEDRGEEEEEEEDGEIVGPVLPKEKLDEREYRIRELEQRAKRMKDRLEGKERSDDKPMVRESWMIELPEDRPNFCGLGARQFLRKTPAEKGDRSCWTDTPADRARKQKKAEEESPVPEVMATSKRDEELTEKVEEYNKAKRAKPLIDLHKKEKKEKQSAAGPKERRPFSREEDMNVNRFDDAQKTTILKKARQLNDRFSSGKAKFL